jgi:phosphatidylserine/phosphatidylglycerophosphate/cardiolipin synthase-like enzyme
MAVIRPNSIRGARALSHLQFPAAQAYAVKHAFDYFDDDARAALYHPDFSAQIRDSDPYAKHRRLSERCESPDPIDKALYVDAKTYMVDGKTIFVGSLNLDPRSARLNTEMGIVLESQALAARFRDRFDPQILDYAYRVELQPDGRTTWTTRDAGREVVVDSEPGMSGFKRFGMFIARVLPMEEQL